MYCLIPTPVLPLPSFPSPLVPVVYNLYPWICFFFAIFTSLFYFLDSIYKWYTVFVFLCVNYFKFIYVVAYGKISFFMTKLYFILYIYIYNIYIYILYMYITLYTFFYWWTLRLLPWNSAGQNTIVSTLFLLQWIFWPRNWTGVSCTAGGFFTSWATRETPKAAPNVVPETHDPEIKSLMLFWLN